MTDVRHVPVGRDLDPIEFDLDALTPDMIRRLAWHGLGQKLADARAGMNRKTEGYTPEKARALCMKVADNLLAGTWGRERGASSAMTPLDARIHKLASAMVRAAIKGSGKKLREIEDDQFDAWVAQVIEQQPGLRDEAQRQLDAERAAPKVDLAALGIKL